MSWTFPIHVSVTLGAPILETGVAAPALWPPMRGDEPAAASFAEAAGWFSLESLAAEHFHWRAALSLALASQLTYLDRGTIHSTAVASWRFSACQFIEADDTQCFVAASDAAVLVAFRGTESLGDWLGNLNTIGTTRDYGRVHRGFLAAFQVVDASVRSVMAQFAGRPVLLTGHSLGGALATIAAAEWQGQFSISGIYTYGQPAVGKGAFPEFIKQHYAGKYFRFVNEDDIVARVPPTYRHVGRLFHFGADGELKNRVESAAREAAGAVLPGVSESVEDPPLLSEAEFDALRARLLAERAQARLEGAHALERPQLEGILPSVRDHNLNEYIAKIAAKAGV